MFLQEGAKFVNVSLFKSSLNIGWNHT